MKDFIADIVIKVLLWVIDEKVKDEEVFTYGERAGKWITDNAKHAIGNAWDGLEGKLQNKTAVFMGGLANGLDYDDKG